MSLNKELRERIDSLVASDDVVLFMKGTRTFPQCGFSATVVQILDSVLPKYTTVNVLTDPAIRQGIKVYADWPTIPQLYIHGEFVGGCDIVRDMYSSGELQTMVGYEAKPPAISVTPAAAVVLKEALNDVEPGSHVHLAISPRFEHSLDIGPANKGALVVEASGVPIVVDMMSAKRAEGLTIDYVDGPQGTGFNMDNPNRPPEVIGIRPAELKAKLDAGEIKELFDVRTPKERETASIPGSKLLDDEAVARLGQIDIKTPIAFYCHHGSRSQAAAEHFRDQGFRNVYNLSGGIDAWSLEVDSSVPRY